MCLVLTTGSGAKKAVCKIEMNSDASGFTDDIWGMVQFEQDVSNL